MLLGAFCDKLVLADWMTEVDGGSRQLRRVTAALGCEAEEGSCGILDAAAVQLDEYFGGKRVTFELDLRFIGTPFQERVWAALMQIPYGSTTTYSAVAEAIGMGAGVRAVANAIGANRMSIIVPCHRVIGSDGSLTGYAGGLDAKRALLALEKRQGTLHGLLF